MPSSSYVFSALDDLTEAQLRRALRNKAYWRRSSEKYCPLAFAFNYNVMGTYGSTIYMIIQTHGGLKKSEIERRTNNIIEFVDSYDKLNNTDEVAQAMHERLGKFNN